MITKCEQIKHYQLMHYLPILTQTSLPQQDGGRTTDSPAKSTQEPQRPKRPIRRNNVEHFDPSPLDEIGQRTSASTGV